MYRLEGVQQIYGTRTVLNVTALTIPERSVLALIGPSGAGKTTLLRLLALLEPPSQGHVTLSLNGRAVNGALEDRRRIAMTFQRPALLSRSVTDNVAYGLRVRGMHRAEVMRRTGAMLERLHLTQVAGARPGTLSGGEMQRVALARALILEPSVLLLDEPTANLDPYNVGLIEAILAEEHARRDLLIVIVTHNVFQAKRLSQQTALLIGGEMVECGPTAQVFSAPTDPRTRAFLSGEWVY